MMGSVLEVEVVGQQHQGHRPGALRAGWQYKVQCPRCPTPGSQGTMGHHGWLQSPELVSQFSDHSGRESISFQ